MFFLLIRFTSDRLKNCRWPSMLIIQPYQHIIMVIEFLSFRFGAFTNLEKALVMVELNKSLTDPFNVRVGFEYQLHEKVYARTVFLFIRLNLAWA